MSLSSSSYNLAKLQPKFQDCQLKDNDTTDDVFAWIKVIGGIVNNINEADSGDGGWELEKLMDNFLGRENTSSSLRPSFLKDSRLQPSEEQESQSRVSFGKSQLAGTPKPPSSEATGETIGSQDSQDSASVAESAASTQQEAADAHSFITDTLSGAEQLPEPARRALETAKALLGRQIQRPPPEEMTTFSPPRAEKQVSGATASRDPQNYGDLSATAVMLDKTLFHTIQTIVKGKYMQVLQGLQGGDRRYTFAIIALWQHASLNSSSRRLTAMDGMSNLVYNGDAGKWKLDFLKRVREVYESKLTLEHWMMHCAFKSFDGKNQQVQGMVVQDINSEKIKGPATNFDALASNYSQFLATMASSGNGKIRYVETKDKNRGGRGRGNGKKGGGKDGNAKGGRGTGGSGCKGCGGKHSRSECPHRTTPCEHCHLEGHIKSMCGRKHLPAAQAREEAKKAQQPKPSTGTPPPTGQANKVSQEDIDSILSRLTGKTAYTARISLPGAEKEARVPPPSQEEARVPLPTKEARVPPASRQTGTSTTRQRQSGPSSTTLLREAWDPPIEKVRSEQSPPRAECEDCMASDAMCNPNPAYRSGVSDNPLSTPSDSSPGTESIADLTSESDSDDEAPISLPGAERAIQSVPMLPVTPGVGGTEQQVQTGNQQPIVPIGDIAISLCDGPCGGAALGLKAAFPEGTGFKRIIAVEKKKSARAMAANVNPKTSTFPGLEHHWDSWQAPHLRHH